MTVKELIEQLERMPQDAPVRIVGAEIQHGMGYSHTPTVARVEEVAPYVMIERTR